MHLIECIIIATKKSTPFSNCITKPVRMSGWNIDMSIAREKSLFWHGLWILCGKPETGQVARIMRFTSNNYHYKIRKIKNESRSHAKQSLANALVNNRTRDYWSEIKKINKSKIEPISIVNGEYAHKDIANLFSCQYKSLYSSVTSDLSELSHMYDSIKADINNVCLSNNHSCGSFYDHNGYRINVVNAIRSLCAGKSDGVDDICSDNLKHATDRFIDNIVSLFNSILSHGCVPISFLSSTIIPIPKNPRLDLKNSENYKAIALSSVFGKFFDKIVIEKQVEQLGTSELQFGYKTNSSTVICSTALTETIEYYVSRKTPVYVLLIDASKAFNRVSHIKLFKTLQAHGVCPLIIRVLYNMYTNSDMQVRTFKCISPNEWCEAGRVPVSYAIYVVPGWIDTEAKAQWYRLSYCQNLLWCLWLC